MYLLAADTSGKNGSIALARCESGRCDVLEVVPLTGGTFSAQLVPEISDLLARRGITKADLDAFAVASGPGSFTGLRIGLAAIKGLAEVLGKPIVPVSLLEAMIWSSSRLGCVIAAMDAGRGEFYSAKYEATKLERKLVQECLLTKAELLEVAKNCGLITPEPGLAALARELGVAVEEVARPGSDAIARFGCERMRAGQTVTPEDLDANYVRRAVDPITAAR